VDENGSAAYEGSTVRLMGREESMVYTPEQYAAHLRNIADILNRFSNYRFYLLPETPFRNIDIVSCADFVKVTSSVRPQFSIVFTHPLLCKAFMGYLDDVRKCYKIDRNSLRKELEGIAGRLSPAL
jgi:hypothetical protein